MSASNKIIEQELKINKARRLVNLDLAGRYA